MRRSPDGRRQRGIVPRLVLAAALTAVTLPTVSCSSTDAGPPLFAALDLPVTLTEFRIRVNDYSEFVVAVLEEAAEDIIDSADDQLVRRNAMEWRLRAVNTFLNALNQPEPVASLIDGWAFVLQLHQFVESGAGAELFGPWQDIAVAGTERIVVEAEQVVIAISQGDPALARDLIHEWVEQNPFTDELLARRTTALIVSDLLERRNSNMFTALGELQVGVDDLTIQMQRYISIMPRTVRWQSQLILHETLYDELKLGDTMATFDIVTADLLELLAFAEDLPDDLKEDMLASITEIGPFLEAERARIIAEVDRQRDLIFLDVGLEREAIMADIEAQIDEIDRQMEGRIDEVFGRVELLTAETVAESFSESERIINLVYRRAFTLLLVALAGGAGLVLLYKWRHPISLAARRPNAD